MSSQLKKVQSGDPLKIPAQTFNIFIDAARDFRSRQQAARQNAQQTFRSSGIILVKNASDYDQNRFAVLGIDFPVITPTDNEDEFKNRLALRGVTPAKANHIGKFVILTEPLADGEIGRAFAHGVCPVKINVIDANHRFADVNDGVTGSLQSGLTGAALILWAESGTGEVWAVVRLGVPSIGTHENPKVLGGSGETADMGEWDVDNQPAGYDGVQFKAIRLYWSGNSGDPVYQFIRTPTYDSIGRLVVVSAEVRSVAFNTGPCEV
ncbi:MAG: hypothetical protein SVV80_11695 [Planctomycetota bacterium]|nr:hypothetical protein [Planctomycetota bacterium]